MEYSEANIISQVFCAKGTKKVVKSDKKTKAVLKKQRINETIAMHGVRIITF